MDVGDDTNEICSCGSLFYDTNDTKIALFVLDKLLEKLFCDADKKSDTKIDISYNPELDERPSSCYTQSVTILFPFCACGFAVQSPAVSFCFFTLCSMNVNKEKESKESE